MLQSQNYYVFFLYVLELNHSVLLAAEHLILSFLCPQEEEMLNCIFLQKSHKKKSQ